MSQEPLLRDWDLLFVGNCEDCGHGLYVNGPVETCRVKNCQCANCHGEYVAR